MKLEHSTTRAPDLGDLLRHWRTARGKSQLDLALDTNISQRHISFIERGRSAPGRQTLMALAQALDVPLRDRNALLLAAGYAPVYADSAWNSHEMHSVTSALTRMLRHHEPFPAVVMDRHWNVLMTNQAAPRFFNSFIDMAARTGPRNMLHLIFDPAGMRPFVADWERVAASLIERVQREAPGRVIDVGTRELLAALRAYPDVTAARATTAPDDSAPLPMIALGFVKDGQVRRYFSMVSTVGTPQSVAAQELRIECLFPADEATEAWHLATLAENQTA